MKGKILLVTGLAVGYVLGSRAGRERYEQIRAAAATFWNSPAIQRQVGHAEEFVKDKAPDVAEFFADGAKKVIARATKQPSAPRAASATVTPRKRAATTRAATKRASTKRAATTPSPTTPSTTTPAARKPAASK